MKLRHQYASPIFYFWEMTPPAVWSTEYARRLKHKCYQIFPVQNLSRLPEEKLELTVITSTDFWQQNSYQIVLKSNNFQSHHLRLERIARESRWSLARPSTSSHCDVRRLNLEDLFSVFGHVSKFHHTSSPNIQVFLKRSQNQFFYCWKISSSKFWPVFLQVICQMSYQLT